MTNETTDLIDYSIAQASISEMQDLYLGLTITDVKDIETYKVCKIARKECRDLRIQIDTRKKEMRRDILSQATALLEPIQQIEDHLKKQEAVIDDEKERVKQAKQRAKEENNAQRLNTLSELGELRYSFQEVLVMSDDEFQAVVKQAELILAERKQETGLITLTDNEVEDEEEIGPEDFQSNLDEASKVLGMDIPPFPVLGTPPSHSPIHSLEADRMRYAFQVPSESPLMITIRGEFPTLELAQREIARLIEIIGEVE